MNQQTILYGVIGVVVLAAAGAGAWWLFSGSEVTDSPTTIESASGGTEPISVAVSIPTETNAVAEPVTSAPQRIAKLVDGPIAGAVVIQTLRPTTTVARYVQQHNGHVFDLPLDSPGAVPRAVSNTTIPGISRVLWAGEGNAALLQYLDGNTIKSVTLNFPPQASTTTRPTTIKFLPDGIVDLAVSPNGASVSYLLRTATGVDGYIAAADGVGSRKVFSLPLSRILISWPAPNTILAQSASALGVPGIAFSINTQSGAVVPLLHAPGLTLTADRTLSTLVYQATSLGAGGPSTFVRDSRGTVRGVSFDPYPERCLWSTATTSTLYCAAPLVAVAENYLDLWRRGSALESEALFSFNLTSGESTILAVPGGEAGGTSSTIDTFTVSKDDRYLLFIRRGDYSLWRVQL